MYRYSTDNGNTWQRLSAVNGTNWFDSSSNQSWRKSIQRWHVSSTEVPNAANVRFRFFLSSDELTQGEGIGIDDIHIFEKCHWTEPGLADKNAVHIPLIKMKVIATKYETTNNIIFLSFHSLKWIL